jgi:GNAT superfamily N-acetyltransferase
MTVQDIGLGMRLKQQAGWNQTEADWRRALELEPDGCFVAELDGDAIGTTTTCIFGPVAWIAMVLVDEKVRGRGVGTALMRHALAFLDGRGVRSVRLDATPLGRPIYEKLGFVPQFELARYEGVPSHGGPLWVRPAGGNDLDKLLRLDREVTGTDRRKLLLCLFAECFADLRVTMIDTRGFGFVTARPGANAIHIGPCIAQGVGRYLLGGAWQRYAGQRVFIDIPVANLPAVQLVAAQGLVEQRRLLRMCRGEIIQERIEELWASFGPEKG